MTGASLPAAAYDVWHDRAVFHFLTQAADRERYISRLKSSLRPNGQLIIATFSLAGPPKCSGLDVTRYDPKTLTKALGDGFTLVESLPETHRTPFGTFQHFVFCRFVRS